MFIILRTDDGRHVAVNIANIAYVDEDGEESIIWFAGDREYGIRVRIRFHELVETIRETQRGH